MTATEKYNGWTNYETWNVKLWMDNEQNSYRYYQDMAQDCWNNSEATTPSQLTREEVAARDLAELIKDEYETAMNDWLEESNRTASVWADLLGASLSEVNWHEIAASMIEDVNKAEPEADEDE